MNTHTFCHLCSKQIERATADNYNGHPAHTACILEAPAVPRMWGNDRVDDEGGVFSTPVEPGVDPKGAAGRAKDQLQLIPPVLNTETAKAIACGAKKYGPWNWRSTRVEVMTYIGAMRRHIDAFLNGEDIDESGAHHLGCVAASCAIVMDAGKMGSLIDNRPPPGRVLMKVEQPFVSEKSEDATAMGKPVRDWDLINGPYKPDQFVPVKSPLETACDEFTDAVNRLHTSIVPSVSATPVPGPASPSGSDHSATGSSAPPAARGPQAASDSAL